jgi:YidC/Oxa1 family membrane protein insertase
MLGFAPLDAAAGVAYDLLIRVGPALTPIDGGAATVLAIVLFTAAVRLALLPLSRRQARAGQAQAKLAPRLSELRAKHRDDPARLNAEIVNLYRESGTSPLASLLSMLLQAPVFLVLYTVFTSPRVGDRANTLLTGDLLGHPLAAHGVAAGWPLLAVAAAIAVVATVTAVRMRRTGQPVWLTMVPYLTLVAAAIMPLAATFYLLTTTTWSAVEAAVLRRDGAPPAPL